MSEKTDEKKVHIAVFGRTNSGKTTLVNAIAGSRAKLIASKPHTTVIPEYKSIEVQPLGSVVFIDTAGFDDESKEVSDKEQRTASVIDDVDVALMLFDQVKMDKEKHWCSELHNRNIPVIPIISKADVCSRHALADLVKLQIGIDPIIVNVHENKDKEILKQAIYDILPEEYK